MYGVYRVLGLKVFRISDLGFTVEDFGFRVSGVQLGFGCAPVTAKTTHVISQENKCRL